MAFRGLFTGEDMLDFEGDDGEVDDVLYPGSDEEFGTQEEEHKM